MRGWGYPLSTSFRRHSSKSSRFYSITHVLILCLCAWCWTAVISRIPSGFTSENLWSQKVSYEMDVIHFEHLDFSLVPIILCLLRKKLFLLVNPYWKGFSYLWSKWKSALLPVQMFFQYSSSPFSSTFSNFHFVFTLTLWIIHSQSSIWTCTLYQIEWSQRVSCLILFIGAENSSIFTDICKITQPFCYD